MTQAELQKRFLDMVATEVLAAQVKARSHN